MAGERIVAINQGCRFRGYDDVRTPPWLARGTAASGRGAAWMPGMDGPTFCRRVKGDPALARVPVVAVTALPVEEARATALAAGCDGCLAKPFDLEDLLALVRRSLRAGA